jgi:hypothetical protein
MLVSDLSLDHSRMVISHLIAKQLLPSRTRPISEGTQNAIGLLNSETYATVKMSCAFEMDLQELLPADEILSLLASPLKVQVIPAVIGSPVKNYKVCLIGRHAVISLLIIRQDPQVVAKLHLASWISALTKHQSVPECINDETGLLTGSEDWSMRLISRSSSSVISIETTDIVDYTYGLRLRLSRIRSTLALLVQGELNSRWRPILFPSIDQASEFSKKSCQDGFATEPTINRFWPIRCLHSVLAGE